MGGDRRRNLIVAPHVDDEVLGCFAFLEPDTHVLYAGVEDRPTRQIRLDELDASAKALGFSHTELDHPVNHYDEAKLVQPIEEAINRLRPETVLIPVPSYNQDHRAVHDAALVATRPHDTNWRVDRVLAYEQVHAVVWPRGSSESPSLFVPIDLDAKIDAYLRYASQVRGHRSTETVRALASLRGAQIGEPAAEAYHVKRLIDRVGA